MVNDITGCGTSLVDTLKVAPEMTVPAPFDTVICVGDTLDFDITGNEVMQHIKEEDSAKTHIFGGFRKHGGAVCADECWCNEEEE